MALHVDAIHIYKACYNSRFPTPGRGDSTVRRWKRSSRRSANRAFLKKWCWSVRQSTAASRVLLSDTRAGLPRIGRNVLAATNNGGTVGGIKTTSAWTPKMLWGHLLQLGGRSRSSGAKAGSPTQASECRLRTASKVDFGMHVDHVEHLPTPLAQ